MILDLSQNKPAPSPESQDYSTPSEAAPACAVEPEVLQPGLPAQVHKSQVVEASKWPLLRFLVQTEVHVYAFAVAANILLSFFPFLVAITGLCRSVLHWQAAADVIIHTLKDYFPDTFGVDFKSYLLSSSRHFSWISGLLLLFTANGIFVPLEVAFNRIWQVKENRSFLRNQVVSLGLIFLCGALVLGSTCLTAVNVQYLTARFGNSHQGAVLQSIVFHVTALIMTGAMIFLIYWKLPNTRIQCKRLIPASIVVAALLEALNYVDILTWPYLSAKLRAETPPFVQSISIILWSFVATLIVLAGAEWSACTEAKTLDGASDNPH